MTDVTEYGEIMLNVYVDEWGFRKIDGVLEDGRRILIAVAVPIIKAWTALLNTVHVFTRPTRFLRLTQALNTVHVFLRPFRRVGYAQQLQPAHVFSSPIRLIRFPAAVQTVHLFSAPTRLVRLVEPLTLRHVYFVAVPAVRKTRLFLVVDSLAIQLT